MMDPAAVAVGLAAFLGPYLPYLVESGEDAAKEAGRKFGTAAWEHAKAIWEQLMPGMETAPGAKTAVERAVERPGDQRVMGSLELELEELLKTSPALTTALTKLLDVPKATRVTVT